MISEQCHNPALLALPHFIILMALLLRSITRHLAKEKPLDAFRTFLEHDAGASVRQTPHQKDRKYLHVEIAERFKQQ